MNLFFRYRLDHILFWVLTVFFHGYTRVWLIDQEGLGQFILELFVRNGLLAVVIYVNLLVIIPRLISSKKVLSTSLLLMASLAFYVLVKNAHDQYLYGQLIRPNFLQNSLYNASIVVFYLAFASALYLSKQWFVQRDLIRKIELDKQNAAARETLSKFSDMLRYQLYECNSHEIPVEKELNYLKNYVELQRLRKDEHYTIQLSCSEELTHFSLPPLLLLPLVENAFKHVSHFSDNENLIKIDLDKKGQFFRFSVVNTKDNVLPKSENGGIGLKNVKRRLELLYKDRYLLDVIDTIDRFEVNLELKIESNANL
jgi:two-component system LytT family sensor kinase